MKRRVLSFLLIWILLISYCGQFVPEAEASPQTHPNTYVNTGDQRKDIIGVALTQVGYREGRNNDTKYGDWYGWPNTAWCGIFVAWCAEQAGVPTSVLRKQGNANPTSYGLTQKPKGYVPISGDLFFTPGYTHVGLVYYVDGDYFYSLEGNTWEGSIQEEGVYLRKHDLASYVFASPNYQGGGDHSYTLGSESAHPHKEYYRCSKCGDMRYTGKTISMPDCIQCKQASCSHSYAAWARVNDSNHVRSCSLCGKQETKSHSWNSGTVTKAATCSKAGSKTQKCTGCGASKTVTIPKTGKHNYGEWEKIDEDTHFRVCADCNYKDTQEHAAAEQWFQDEKTHWHNCPDCLEQFQQEDHAFGETCDSPCEICGYLSPDGHLYSEWETDGTKHWQTCEKCSVRSGEAEHEFTAACDDLCDTCGFKRDVEHVLEESFATNEYSHWYNCTVCGGQLEKENHIATVSKRQGDLQFCTVCDYQITPDSEHIHAYDHLETDGTMHWGSCMCGQVMESQPHTWSVQTGACSVCGAVNQPVTQKETEIMPWIIAGSAGGVLLLVLIIALIVGNRNKEYD